MEGGLGLVLIEPGEREADVEDHIVADRDLLEQGGRDLAADAVEIDRSDLTGVELDDAGGEREADGSPPDGHPQAAMAA